MRPIRANRATEVRSVNGPGELKADDAHYDEAKAQQASECDRFTEDHNTHNGYQGRPKTRPDCIGELRPSFVGPGHRGRFFVKDSPELLR